MTGAAGLFGPDLRMLGDPGAFLSGTPVLLERTCPPPLGRGACVDRQANRAVAKEVVTHTHTLSWSRPDPCPRCAGNRAQSSEETRI